MSTELSFKIIGFAALIISIILHEVAHAYAALRCGDTTARDAGRITLNPIPHIDLVGSIILPGLLVLSGSSFFLAWAKPVPINIARCRNPRDAYWITAVAGPLANLAQALVAVAGMAAVWKFSGMAAGVQQPLITSLLEAGSAATLDDLRYVPEFWILCGSSAAWFNAFHAFILYGMINIMLMVFNLIPVPPLDGSRVLTVLLPREVAWRYAQIERYGFIVLILFINTPFFREFFTRIRLGFFNLVSTLLNAI